MKAYYSCAELAAMKLDGYPTSKPSVKIRVEKEGWLKREVPAKGGKGGVKTEYQLPAHLARALHNKALATQVAAIAPAADGSTAVAIASNTAVPANAMMAENISLAIAQMTDDQRDVMQARENLMRFVSEFKGSVSAALDFINAAYADGTLNAHLTWSMKNAWDKPREPLVITRSTYNKWCDVKNKRGVAAPLKPQKDMRVKPWHAAAIALKQRPQGTTYQYILDELQPQFPYLTYGMITRFFSEKFSKSDVLKGRHTGSALKAHQKYQTRDTSDIEPWGELHMDGWNTHFTAPHPVSGQYVTYEIWHAHDIATKYTPPVSIGLTENFEVIAKCIENAIRFGGVPRIIQTDSTKVIKNSARMKTDPHTALAERFGFSFVHPKQVGNSQANGTPENFNTSLDRASRELATYQGKGMDSLTLKRVKKITAKLAKAQADGDVEATERYLLEAQKQGKGLVFTSWDQAVAWINDTIEKLNNRPHRSLPKIADATTGKMRHQTPAEALKAAYEAGWQPVLVEESILEASFRTHVKVKVTRQMVSPYGGMKYSAPALDHHEGETVVVVYDSMNYETVTVKDLHGSVICTANFMHSIKRAQSYKDYTEEKRALAQIKLRQTQIEQIVQNTPSLANEYGEVIEGNFRRDDGLIDVPKEMPKPPEPERAFEHEMPEKVTEKSWSETLMWLHGDSESDPKPKELAAIS